MKSLISTLLSFALAVCCRADAESEKMRCLDSPLHKPFPSEEPGLYKTCSVYEGLSCCTNTTAVRIHNADLYFFDHVICNGNNMSAACKKFFLKNACFYECSPHVGNWIEKDDAGVHRELKNVPLCRSDCDAWFSACSNETTCANEWKHAVFDGSVVCKKNDTCQTVKARFKSSQNFCEKVWKNTYTVVSDESSCMKINLSSKKDQKNNEAVANKDNVNSSSAIQYDIIILLYGVLSYKLFS